MSHESVMVKKCWVEMAEITDEEMLRESEVVDEGFVLKQS